jgi:hypothetical protein
LDFFISYKTKDKQLAGKVAQYLQGQGHTFFLAHDDLELSPDFEEDIKGRIKDCTALLAVVTPNSADAAYPNQEVGYALALDKPIIPLWFPDVHSEELGFLKRVNAIPTSEDKLQQSVMKAIDWAEAAITTNFVHPPEGDSMANAIDSFLELRREPYYRVLLKPQGTFALFSPSAENDSWLVTNKPKIFNLMNWKSRANGIEFTHQDPVRAEVDWTGTLCYGRLVPRIDGIVLEAFLRIIAELLGYSKRIFDRYGWNQQNHGLLRIEFKIGHAHGQSLKTFHSSPISGIHKTDLQEVVVDDAVPITFDLKSVLAKILIKTCREFGYGMPEQTADLWVAIALGPEQVGIVR